MAYVKTCLFILSLFLPQSVFAEYRVFLLEVRSAPKKPDQGIATNTADSSTRSPANETSEKPAEQVRYITSTLDPLQYKYYYPLQADEVISYTQTWMCRGRTGNEKPYCPNPKLKTEPPVETTPTPTN